MKKIILYILLGVLSCTYISCEQGYKYSYRLENDTDTIISVHFKTNFIDSTIFIEPGKETEIFNTFHGLEGFNGPFFSKIKRDFFYINIKKGILESRRNYLQTKEWKFSKKGNVGVYFSKIEQWEF